MDGSVSDQIRRWRETCLELSLVQDAIREKMKADRAKLDLTQNEYATLLGLHWGDVARIENGSTALTIRHRGAARICQRFDLDVKHLELLCDQISNDCVFGVTLFSQETINIVFDLLEPYLQHKHEMTMKVYAELFGGHADIVEGVLLYTGDSLKKLHESRETREDIFTVLIDDSFNARVEMAIGNELDEIEALADAARELQKKLAERYPTRRALASALGMGITGVNAVLNFTKSSKRRVYKKTAEGVLEALRKLLNGKGGSTPPPAAKEVRAVMTAAATPGKPESAETAIRPSSSRSLVFAAVGNVRGAAKLLELLLRDTGAAPGAREKLEIARLVMDLISIGDLDEQTLRDALHGRPLEESKEALRMLRSALGS